MRNVRSRSCKNLSVVISVVRHSSPFVAIRRRLLECKDDITGHLQSCHLSKLVGSVEEHDVILMKAGKFDLPTHQQESMWICPKHRYNLGRNDMPIPSPFRSKEKTEERRCGQSTDVQKYSNYFWGNNSYWFR